MKKTESVPSVGRSWGGTTETTNHAGIWRAYLAPTTKTQNKKPPQKAKKEKRKTKKKKKKKNPSKNKKKKEEDPPLCV